MRTLDEAIAHEKRLVDIYKAQYECDCDYYGKNTVDKYSETNEIIQHMKEHEQYLEWFEELKDYRDKNKIVVRIDCINLEEFKDMAVKLAKEQYNKAIDHCVKEVEKEEKQHNHTITKDCLFWLKRKIEQLKAGGENV